MTRGLDELKDEAHRIAVEHGFKDASVGEDVALFCSEAAELLEDHRDGSLPHEVWYEESIPVYDNMGSPLAIDGSVYVEGGEKKRLMAKVRHKEPYAMTDTPCPLCEGRGADCLPCRGTGNKLRLFKPCGIPSEAADVIVRICHFAGKHGIALAKAVDEKMAYNESRPFKHGNKKL